MNDMFFLSPLRKVPLSYEPFPVFTTNYPYPYDDNTTATALLIAPDGYRIFLNISDFGLEDGFDFLRVGFEPDPTSEDYASVLTGNDLDLPYTTVTPGRTLSLKFTSDGGVADIGFYGQAYIIPEEGRICELSPAMRYICLDRFPVPSLSCRSLLV